MEGKNVFTLMGDITTFVAKYNYKYMLYDDFGIYPLFALFKTVTLAGQG
jgi:hypothetical protein